jgi:hypothetical protein
MAVCRIAAELAAGTVWFVLGLWLRRLLTLSADEFIRRFLQHTVSGGFHRISHIGFRANCQRAAKLTLCSKLLAAALAHVVRQLMTSSPLLRIGLYRLLNPPVIPLNAVVEILAVPVSEIRTELASEHLRCRCIFLLARATGGACPQRRCQPRELRAVNRRSLCGSPVARPPRPARQRGQAPARRSRPAWPRSMASAPAHHTRM